MHEDDALARQFEQNRTHLRAVAYRILGSSHEADDAVQDAWLRLSRSDTTSVGNLGGWLTTVVARICLDMLRARSARSEALVALAGDGAAGPAGLGGPVGPGGRVDPAGPVDPAEEAELADSVGLALLVVLDTLAPAERLAFVLHDLFGVPFEEIAPIVGRSPAASRQLASRARRRVRGASPAPDVARQRAVVAAFLAASREGDLARLVAVLDPAAELTVDAAGSALGAAGGSGAAAVASTFVGRARAARLALLDGMPGAAWLVADEPRVVFAFTVAGDRVVGISLVADPETLAELEIVLLE